MKFEIKNRWTGQTQYTCELSAEVAGLSYALQLGFAVKSAVAGGANLRGANLRGADLRGADLGDANLRDANLRSANLRDANLRGADLGDANLRDADLRDANLRGANLRGADLRGADLGDANLRDANLRSADLRDANLRGADLRGADLTPIRDDLWAVLSSAPGEAHAVRDALAGGRVDGSTYSGECACLVGTIANARHCTYGGVPGLVPNDSRPAERFFMAIRPGDTPETSEPCKLAHEWVCDWIVRVEAAFAPKAKS